MNYRGMLSAACAFVLLAGLVGCSPTDATPEPDGAVGFDGTCGSLLSEKLLSNALSEKTTARMLSSGEPDSIAVAIAGGIQCIWDGNDGRGFTTLLTVLPSTGIVTPTEDSLVCAGGTMSCEFAATVNGYWLTGSIGGPADIRDDATATAELVRDAAVSALAEGEPRAAFAAADGSWTRVDCADVAQQSDLFDQPGLPDFAEVDFLGGGGEARAVGTRAAMSATEITCVWVAESPSESTGQEQIWLTVHPGGAAVGDEVIISAGGEANLAGIDRSVLTYSDADVQIDAFVGANWLSVRGPTAHLDAYVAALPSVFSALDAA